jgi:hypothetical protein
LDFIKKKSDFIRAIPQQFIALLILLLEVMKQIRNIAKGFDPWALPFHFCSMFVFFFPLAQFGNEKMQKIFKPTAFSCAIAMMIGFYISPISIIGHACNNVLLSFNSFHTFTFHHLVILYFFLSIFLKNYKPTKYDFKYVAYSMLGYSLIGTTLAYMLNTNYCNFLYGTIDFLEIIRMFSGQSVFTMIILLGIIGGPTLLSYINYLIYSIKNFKYINKENTKQ